jgi:hypothetical protein
MLGWWRCISSVHIIFLLRGLQVIVHEPRVCGFRYLGWARLPIDVAPLGVDADFGLERSSCELLVDGENTDRLDI